MNLDYKKLALMILIAAAVIALIFLIYFFFVKPFSAPPPADQEQTAGSDQTLPTAGQSTGQTSVIDGISQTFPAGSSQTGADNVPDGSQPTKQTNTTPLTDFPVYFAASSNNGDLVYYSSDGKFYRINPNGQVTAFSDKVFHNVSNVVWSNGKDKAILQYPDGSNIIYDFNQNKQITLQKHWTDFTFSPSDQQIAFKSIGLDPENRFLAVGDNSGSNLKIIESIGGVENKFQINWSPNNSMIANFIESNGINRTEIYFVGLNNENFKSMTVEGRGFEGLWSPDGTAMVYSVYNTSDYTPQLWISGAGPENIGAGRNVLGLNTWADKCSFSDATTLYCAVPQEMPYGAGLESGLTIGISDDIYKIDLQTGAKQLISGYGDHRIDKIFPLSGGSTLLFTDANTGEIYRVEL